MKDLSWCICHLCGAEAPGAYGWAPKGTKPKITCAECWPIAEAAWPKLYRQSTIGREARDRAGEQGGAYLEKVGTTDVAALTPEQWGAFLDTLFRARESELRRLYSTEAPER